MGPNWVCWDQNIILRTRSVFLYYGCPKNYKLRSYLLVPCRSIDFWEPGIWVGVVCCPPFLSGKSCWWHDYRSITLCKLDQCSFTTCPAKHQMLAFTMSNLIDKVCTSLNTWQYLLCKFWVDRDFKQFNFYPIPRNAINLYFLRARLEVKDNLSSITLIGGWTIITFPFLTEPKLTLFKRILMHCFQVFNG